MMRTLTRRAFYVLVLMTGLFALPGATCVEAPISTIVLGEQDENPGSDASANEIVDLVNAIRLEYGLEPLASDPLLAQAAQAYAQRMAEMNFFDHVDPHTGTMPWDRAEQAGYAWSFIAENLAAGQFTPESVVDGWMNSPGHRANILSPDPTEIGVGIYEGGLFGIYWVQLFGTPE
jgi:uncharacterized protein YkwD